METHTEEVCSICLEKIIVPVEPLNLSCYKKTDLWCFAVKRVCLQCLEQYLGLNRPRLARPSRKCLFCPENNLPFCSKQDCFRIDYGMMSRDPDPISCPYCSTFRSSHVSVARHIFSECPEYHLECDCGSVFARKDRSSHVEKCDKFTKCGFCEDFVRNTEIAKHMFYQHDKTKCFTCHQYIGMNVLNDHLIYRCKERVHISKKEKYSKLKTFLE